MWAKNENPVHLTKDIFFHFSCNHQANGINIRIIPIIPTPHLLNFQEFSRPPIYSNPTIIWNS